MVSVRIPDVTDRGVQALGWAAAAGWAAVFPLAGAGPNQSLWGALAAPSYALAALLRAALPRRPAGPAAAVAGLLGAVLAPLVLLSVHERRQSEVMVVERSADLLVHTGLPYLTAPVLPSDYNPYLPLMTLFGLPRAWLGNVGPARLLAGDARIWFALVFLLGLLACGRLLGRRRTGLPLAALTASPLIALPLAVGGVDLPLIGLCCLALALAGRSRPVAAGLVLGLACGLKWTAWPALPVLALLLHHRRGPTAAGRFALAALLTTAAAVLPLALGRPDVLRDQVLRFPLGLGSVPTPAGSPLPGKLLAGLGPAGHALSLTLLALAALGLARYALAHPPATATAAADLLAAGFTLAVLLAPAARFGYLALPAVLLLWPRLTAGQPGPPPIRADRLERHKVRA
ncbi:glycosyltransferase 87 family protein [Kitasatospora sp. NPDC002227]|uniref:glycosyltransferase 87 family protein n=1 Tax=Kitasatospora sp. NPDC002227 TaxID=3154773 RepID=UPI003319EC1A